MIMDELSAIARRWGDLQASPIKLPVPVAASETESGAAEIPATDFPILIVEDDFLVALNLETGLIDAGFRVVGIAASADEAIALAASDAPLVVLMDIRLAGRRDGIDAAIDIFRRHGIRSVFTSAHADPYSRRRAAPANPLGWIEKPYAVSTIVSFLDRLKRPTDADDI